MESPPAAAAGRSKEAGFHVFNGRQAPSKSNSNSLCKALIVVIFLLVIPLFPSQAPDFITHSVFTEFWEILHLLFIGIAVSYGLFCRKSDQLIDPDRAVHSTSDESYAYLSGISHLSSFFEDGYDNMCEPHERDVMHSNGNCRCFLSRDKCVVHGGSKIRAFISDDMNEDNSVGNVKNVNQTWCSQYLKSESLVVVSNGKYFVGESSDFKPLNLPVRSLRSTVAENEKSKSNISLKSEAKNNEDGKVLKIRGVVPMNLEKKFDEVAGRSSIPWRSNSGREDKNNSKVRAHCRPHSVGEVEFEHIKSRSYLVPTFSSSPEFVSSSIENLEDGKDFSVSHSKLAPLNGEALFSGAKSWLPSASSHGEVDKVGRGKHAIDTLDSGIESSALGKVLSKPKSVRTIKTRKYTTGEVDQTLGQMHNKFEADTLVKRGGRDESKTPLVIHQNHEFDGGFAKQNLKSMVNELRSEEKEGIIDDGSVIESEERTGSELDKPPAENDPRTTNLDVDSELEGSEVDRKAGEFIAKFREQIRLQKISPAEG